MPQRVSASQLNKRLNQLADGCTPQQQKESMEHIGQTIRRTIIRGFDDETAPEIVPGGSEAQSAAGKPWAPLAESTKRTKAAVGKEKKLVMSGAMKRRISYDVTVTIDSCRVEVGTNVQSTEGAPYPVYIQSSTTKMPARPFIGSDEDDVDDAIDRILEGIIR